MKVVVAGASGLTGRRILHLLKEAGHEPRAMIRNYDQRPELEALGAECVFGDLEKPVGYAVRGARAALFAAGSGSKTGPEKTIDVDQNGAMAMIETCVRMNVHRFIMLSSMACDDVDRCPKKLHHYMRAKAIADQMLSESGLNFTIVRPGYLTNDTGTGKIKVGANLGHVDEAGKISREDVAATMVACLSHNNTIGKTFEMLAGETPIAEALDSL